MWVATEKMTDEQHKKWLVELDDRFWEAARAAVPDVDELLERLKEAVPGIEVLGRLAVTSPDDRPHVSIDVRHQAQLRQLMDVLRRGLAGEGDGVA